MGFELSNISEFEVGLPVTLAYGVEIYEDQQVSRRDGAPCLQTPDAEQSFYAAFAQAEVALAPGLTLTGGLRFDAFETRPERSFSDSSDEELSPKRALSWRPTENTQVYASASRSFRAPSLTELIPQGQHFIAGPGFPLGPPGSPVFTGSNDFLPSPDLKPETADQIEIAMRHRMQGVFKQGDRLDLSGNVYYSNVDDFIDTVVTFMDLSTFDPITNTVSGSTISRNVDAELYGLEASADYDARRWFGCASLTIPRGEGDDGNGELGSIPQNRLVLTGGLRPVRGLEVGARVTFLRELDEGDVPEGTRTVDSAEVLDIFANWQVQRGALKGVTVLAGVDNVFDQNYRVHPNGLNNPGVTAKFGLGAQF